MSEPPDSGVWLIAASGLTSAMSEPTGERQLAHRSECDRVSGSVEGVGEGVPTEHGALDPHRELDHALERFEVTEWDVSSPGCASTPSIAIIAGTDG